MLARSRKLIAKTSTLKGRMRRATLRLTRRAKPLSSTWSKKFDSPRLPSQPPRRTLAAAGSVAGFCQGLSSGPTGAQCAGHIVQSETGMNERSAAGYAHRAPRPEEGLMTDVVEVLTAA